MAWQTIYRSTNLTIERDDQPVSGSGTDEDPYVYWERHTHQPLPQFDNRVDEYADPTEAALRQRLRDLRTDVRDNLADRQAKIDTINQTITDAQTGRDQAIVDRDAAQAVLDDPASTANQKNAARRDKGDAVNALQHHRDVLELARIAKDTLRDSIQLNRAVVALVRVELSDFAGSADE